MKTRKRIGILGSGNVGQTIGAGFAALGHQVKVGSRTPNSEKLKSWLSRAGPGASTGTFSEASDFGEIIVVATVGSAVKEAIDLAGASNIAGKLVIDAANPLDFSKGRPPGLFLGMTDSLGEMVQRAVPSAKVVKCFNTVPNVQMFRPSFKDVDMMICGNDAAAKQEVGAIVRAFGWKGVLDIGGIDGARWLEAFVPLWVRTCTAVNSWDVVFKVLHS